MMAPRISRHWNMKHILRNCKIAHKFLFLFLQRFFQLHTPCPAPHSTSFLECSLLVTVSSVVTCGQRTNKIFHWGFRSLICGINLFVLSSPFSDPTRLSSGAAGQQDLVRSFNFYSIANDSKTIVFRWISDEVLVPQEFRIWVSINLGNRLKSFHTQILCLHL